MRKLRYCIIVFVSAAALFYPKISSAQQLTLDSILIRIEHNHPELKMYDARISAFDTYSKGAKSLEPPKIGAGLFMTPYNTPLWKEDEMSEGMGSFMLSAEQMFTNPGKLNANAVYMSSMSQVEREMKSATRNEIFRMARMNYYGIQVMQKKLSVLNESEELLDYIIQSTEIRYTYGMDKLNAYYKAKAMLGDIQQMKIMIRTDINRMKTELNTLMVSDPDNALDIDTALVFKNYENAITDSAAIRNGRSDYRGITQSINSLRSKQIYERSARRPDFGIKYDHMIAFGRQPEQFSIMAMMTIPIVPWSSKMYKSSVAGLNYEIEALKNQQQSLVNNTFGTIHNIQLQIKDKKQQIALYEKTILPSMKNNYRTTLLAYEQNTEELFMALDAWQNLKVAQLGYLDLINDLLQLQVQYEKELEIK